MRVESGIDGRRRNLDRLPAFPSDARFHPEVKWEKWALTRHLEELGRTDDDGMLGLQVMGPDEFHSHVDNNAFTNYLAQWHLHRAVAAYRQLAQENPEHLAELSARIGLEESEPERWTEVAEGLSILRGPDGLIEQFEGYFQREDIAITTWDANDMPQYPEGYHHFNLEDSMLLKQPDVVMLPFMLPEEWDSLGFRLSWHGNTVDVEITREATSFRLNAPAGSTEEILLFGEPLKLVAEETVTGPGPQQPAGQQPA